jgi:hypothetical protein
MILYRPAAPHNPRVYPAATLIGQLLIANAIAPYEPSMESCAETYQRNSHNCIESRLISVYNLTGLARLSMLQTTSYERF